MFHRSVPPQTSFGASATGFNSPTPTPDAVPSFLTNDLIESGDFAEMPAREQDRQVERDQRDDNQPDPQNIPIDAHGLPPNTAIRQARHSSYRRLDTRRIRANFTLRRSLP